MSNGRASSARRLLEDDIDPVAATEGKLAQRLANSYPTGALARFDVECPWSEIDEGSGKLMQFVIPRELKAPE